MNKQRRLLRALLAPHLLRTLAPHLCRACAALVPHLCRTCAALVPHLFRTCATLVPHLCRTCAALVPHLCRTCAALVPHLCRNVGGSAARRPLQNDVRCDPAGDQAGRAHGAVAAVARSVLIRSTIVCQPPKHPCKLQGPAGWACLDSAIRLRLPLATRCLAGYTTSISGAKSNISGAKSKDFPLEVPSAHYHHRTGTGQEIRCRVNNQERRSPHEQRTVSTLPTRTILTTERK